MGTIVLFDTGTSTYGDLIVDDNSYGALDIPIPSSNFTGTPATLIFDSVTVKNKARMKIPGNCKLSSVGDINIGTSADDTDTAQIIAGGRVPAFPPIAQWKMNDNVADSYTVEDNIGTNHLTAKQYTSVLHTTGITDGALTFNGSTDYLESTANMGISGAEARSISFWAKPTADPVTGTDWLFVTGNTTTNDYQRFGLYITSDDIYLMAGDGSATNVNDTGADLNGTDWQFHTLVYDGTDVKYYLNGRLYETVSSVTLDTAASPLYIGSDSAGANTFAGTIDNLFVYNRVLSVYDVNALYNAGSGVEVFYDSGAALTATNINIHGVTGTGAAITANGLGFEYNYGPGAGGIGTSYGAGGGYGGAGGDSSDGGTGGSTYGLATNPMDLGSGGGATDGGSGGSAISIEATGTLTVAGQLISDGSDAAGSSNAGGASGGSIKGVVNTLAGAGIITADGGDGDGDSTNGGGGGGAGRIFFMYDTKTFSGTLQSNGGAAGGTNAQA
ncbi:MAG: LamG domain-containing protein, partial [Hyphomicrobiaceae bacterium]|nr:LamG domain-containing protein [Hyphomicrobiaceae bacterium]